jgi:hypothetical protein
MKLGHSFEIVIAAPDPSEAVEFYRSKGWQNVTASTLPGGIRMTDGVIVVSLEPGKPGTTKLRYFNNNLADLTAELVKLNIKTTGDASGTRFEDPSGLEIEVRELPESSAIRAQGTPISTFGQFGEFSLESDDLKGSFAFWSSLGFEPTQYNPNPVSSWASLSDGLLNLGIYGKGHCKHIFRGAVITYFNEDMAARIRQLKNDGVTFAQELGGDGETSNAVLEAPHKQMFFLFSY